MAFKTLKKKFKSWSNSRWGDYARCPAYAHYKHIQKLPEPKHPAMARGIAVANMEEDFFKGKLKTLPVWPSKNKVESADPGSAKWTGNVAQAKRDGIAIHPNLAPLFKAIKKASGLIVEENWGFDVNWEQVDYFDWDNCWLRVKVDVGWTVSKGKKLIVHLRDNKTGKYSEYQIEDYMRQLRIYAAAAATMYPDADEIHVGLHFTDLGIEYPEAGPLVITRAEALKFQKEWSKTVKPMFNDTRFDPTPNNKCKWCHYRKDNGGPCKF